MGRKMIFSGLGILLLTAVFLYLRQETWQFANLTRHPAIDSQPAVSPDGSRIAFISSRDGSEELYVMNCDGSRPQRLTRNAFREEGPAWSAAGDSIFYVSQHENFREIFSLDPRQGIERKIYGLTFSDCADLYCLPNGTDILLVAADVGLSGCGLDILRLNLEQMQAVNLTHTPGDELNPHWSEAAKKLVFTGKKKANWQIYALAKEGLAWQNLSRSASDDSSPRWSIDGRWIVYVSVRAGQTQIWQMAAEGSDKRCLVDFPGKNLWPDWLPDGSGIVFCAKNTGNGDIFKLQKKKRWQVWLEKIGWRPAAAKTTIVAVQPKDEAVFTQGTGGELGINLLQSGFRYIPQGFPYRKSAMQTDFVLSDSPVKKLLREPQYRGSPRYGVLLIGNGVDNRFVFAVDQTPNSKAVLYLDANNNSDLTDDPGPLQNQGTGKLACQAEVKVEYRTSQGTVSQPYRFWIFFNEDDGGHLAGGAFYALCYYEGGVELAGQLFRAFAFDQNADGIYADDGLFVDLNRDQAFADENEHFYLGEPLAVAGHSFRLTELQPAPWPGAGITIQMRFGSGVSRRLIQGEGAVFSTASKRVFCWTQVNGASAPSNIRHVWMYKGKIMATVLLPIESISYRTWSAKWLIATWKGKWLVQVFDDRNRLLGQRAFRYE
jgi:hypothetical protein